MQPAIAATDAQPDREYSKRFYEERLRSLGETISHLSARYRRLINIEFALTLALSVLFYLLYTHRIIGAPAGVFTELCILAIPAKLLRRTVSNLNMQRRIERYYQTRMLRLNGEWSGTGDDGADFAVENHPYCADLDVLGKGSLFEYLCSAQTGAGREWIANSLLHSAPVEQTLARQKAVQELRSRHDLREYFAAAAHTER